MSGQTTSTTPRSVNVRVPATFTLRPGGALSPRTITVPAFLAVRITVLARDGRSHRVVLRTPVPSAFSIPAGGRGSALIHGQRAGQYAVVIDGRVRGTLSVGGEPGP